MHQIESGDHIVFSQIGPKPLEELGGVVFTYLRIEKGETKHSKWNSYKNNMLIR